MIEDSRSFPIENKLYSSIKKTKAMLEIFQLSLVQLYNHNRQGQALEIDSENKIPEVQGKYKALNLKWVNHLQ